MSQRNDLVRHYLQATRTGTYGFLAALPLVVLYEVLLLLVTGGRVTTRVGAEVWMKELLVGFGMAGSLALALGVVLVGAVVIYRERGQVPKPRASYFGWMLVESAVYAVVVALLVSNLVRMLLAASLLGPAPEMLTMLVLSLGAGVYEEFLFRVVLVGGMAWLLNAAMHPTGAYLTAALVGAFVFSLVHYLGPLGDAFTLGSFLFRFLFGLALNALYLTRGFGVAAWTHALYDVLVTLLGAQ